MKIAVVGSRTFSDYTHMCDVLAPLCPPGTIIVSGGASGADRLAERFAGQYGLATEIYPADWETHGKAAGPIRNKLIVAACDSVVAFWDGHSRGTINTIELARAAGKPVTVVLFKEMER